jgi:hypothetical protein
VFQDTLITESAVPVPKIKPSGWNLAHVKATGVPPALASPSVDGALAADETLINILPVRISENAQCSSVEHESK